MKTKEQKSNIDQPVVSSSASRKWQYRTDEYDCNNCTGGIVKVEHAMKLGQGKVEVKKCNNCNHQYYIKQLTGLKEHCL